MANKYGKLHQNAEFDSYEEFKKEFDAYCQKTKVKGEPVKFVHASAKYIKNNTLPSDEQKRLQYMLKSERCKFAGKSTCEAAYKLVLHSKADGSHVLRLDKFDGDHNSHIPFVEYDTKLATKPETVEPSDSNSQDKLEAIVKKIYRGIKNLSDVSMRGSIAEILECLWDRTEKNIAYNVNFTDNPLDEHHVKVVRDVGPVGRQKAKNYTVIDTIEIHDSDDEDDGDDDDNGKNSAPTVHGNKSSESESSQCSSCNSESINSKSSSEDSYDACVAEKELPASQLSEKSEQSDYENQLIIVTPKSGNGNTTDSETSDESVESEHIETIGASSDSNNNTGNDKDIQSSDDTICGSAVEISAVVENELEDDLASELVESERRPSEYLLKPNDDDNDDDGETGSNAESETPDHADDESKKDEHSQDVVEEGQKNGMEKESLASEQNGQREHFYFEYADDSISVRNHEENGKNNEGDSSDDSSVEKVVHKEMVFADRLDEKEIGTFMDSLQLKRKGSDGGLDEDEDQPFKRLRLTSQEEAILNEL